MVVWPDENLVLGALYSVGLYHKSDAGHGDFCRAESQVLLSGVEEVLWTPSPDGSFIVTVEPRGTAQLWLIQNWFDAVEELEQGAR